MRPGAFGKYAVVPVSRNANCYEPVGLEAESSDQRERVLLEAGRRL
jgi:hypothetical protein